MGEANWPHRSDGCIKFFPRKKILHLECRGEFRRGFSSPGGEKEEGCSSAQEPLE
jgi:hypothetical protein